MHSVYSSIAKTVTTVVLSLSVGMAEAAFRYGILTNDEIVVTANVDYGTTSNLYEYVYPATSGVFVVDSQLSDMANTNYVVDTVTNAKPQRIYNRLATNALDNEGNLYRSSEDGDYWTKNGLKYYFVEKDTWRNWHDGQDVTAYKYSSNPAGGGWDFAYIKELGWLRGAYSNLATGLPANKNPDEGDEIDGTYNGYSFTSLKTRMDTSPYDHLVKSNELSEVLLGYATTGDIASLASTDYVNTATAPLATTNFVKGAIKEYKPKLVYDADLFSYAHNATGELFSAVIGGNYFIYNDADRYSYYTNTWDSTWGRMYDYRNAANTQRILYRAPDGSVRGPGAVDGISSTVYSIAKDLNPLNGDDLGPTNIVSGYEFHGQELELAQSPYDRFATTSEVGVVRSSIPWTYFLVSTNDVKYYSATNGYYLYNGSVYRFNDELTNKCTVVTNVNWVVKDSSGMLVASIFTNATYSTKVLNCHSGEYATTNYVVDAVTNAKPQRIYNNGATDALDDKGQLYKSNIVPGHWSTYSSSGAFYRNLYFTGVNNGVYRWDAADTYYVTYNSNNGQIYVYPNANVATVDSGLNPLSIECAFADVFQGSAVYKYTPSVVSVEENPYAHFALEALPDRAWTNSYVYSFGDLVNKDGVAYRYTNTVSASGSWSAANWQKVPTLTPLSGKLYDFNFNSNIVKALADVVKALGGSVTNNPTGGN